MTYGPSRLEYYQTRAKEIRELARRCRDAAIREQLLETARQFETLAQLVEDGTLSDNKD